MSKITPQEKYDKANTTRTTIKFNFNTDKDLLEAIKGKPKQTEIKRLMRLGLAVEKSLESTETTHE